MLQKHSDLIMKQLQPSDIVLDIGGWAHPFNRANYILDQEPYETRGYYNRTFRRNNPLPPLGGEVEHFTAKTWIQRDICSHEPFPFKDKEIDYVICSHTLEDIRDPLSVCAEMIRVAKRGYIEIPSRIWETCRGFEPGIVGLAYHRWLIDITGNEISFTMKFHSIHGHWRLSLPRRVDRTSGGGEDLHLAVLGRQLQFSRGDHPRRAGDRRFPGRFRAFGATLSLLVGPGRLPGTEGAAFCAPGHALCLRSITGA